MNLPTPMTLSLTFEDVDLPDLFREVTGPAPNPHGAEDRHVHGFGGLEILRHGSAGQDITPVPVGVADLVGEGSGVRVSRVGATCGPALPVAITVPSSDRTTTETVCIRLTT